MYSSIPECNSQSNICKNDNCRILYEDIRKIAYFLNLPQDQFCEKFACEHLFHQEGCCIPRGKYKPTCLFHTGAIQTCNEKNLIGLFDLFEREFVFDATNEKCEKCQKADGTVVTSSQMKNEEYMKSLGFWKQKDGVYRPHPNCKCTWLSGFEDKYKKVKNLLSGLIKLKELKDFYNTKVPKPPRMTEHSGAWTHLVWMWFFEQGPNPIYFPESSPYSKDIAKSFSINTEVRDYYKKNNEMPDGWRFTGPKTAPGNLGEVEWFIGTYDIQNVNKKDDGIHFTVHNCSSWHSGTRLPESWTNKIKDMTGLTIKDLVSSAPRGEVLQTKVRERIPALLLKLKWVNDILNRLPSFGGNWDQYFDVVVRWDE